MKTIILFLAVFIPGILWGSKVDSLTLALERQLVLNNLPELYQLHYLLGIEYNSPEKEAYEQASIHFEKALKIAKEISDIEKNIEILYQLGKSHERQNNFQQALEYFFEAIELEKVSDIKNPRTAYCFTHISSIYQALGDYEKAFKNQMQALLIFEIKKDSLGEANSYYNIGSIFYYQKQYERALEAYQKSMHICELLNDEEYVYSCLAALGSVYEKLNFIDKSLEYNERSLVLAKKLNYKSGIGYSLGNIAANYMAVKNYVEAEKFLKESIALKVEIGDKWGSIGNNIDLSKLYLQTEQPQKSLDLLQQTLELAVNLNSKTRQPEIYELMAKAYDQLQKPIEAYKTTKKYIALRDSMLNEKTVEEMGKSKRRYEVQKKENEIRLLKKENELLAKNEKIRNLQVYIFAAIFIIFLMFIWWYKSRLKYQSQVNKLLEDNNTLLNTKNEEIHVKNKQLELSNQDLQQFAYVASHDLKEPLRMINSYSNMLERKYNDLLDDNGKEFLHYIIDAVNRMGTLLDDLLDFSRAGAQAPPKKVTKIKDVLCIVESNLRHRFQTLNATLILADNDFPSVKVHRSQLIQLLQNLISNGVKFTGEEDPVVTVGCIRKGDQFIISVKDNGIGISQENLEKVFEMFRRLHTREKYEGTGIGLATCKRIVSNWGGGIWVESEVGKGSTFYFTIPCSLADDENFTIEKIEKYQLQ